MSGQDYEQLTLYPEDSHASPFPWLESKRGKKTTVTYGLRCYELSKSCARVASSVKTFLESSRLPPGRWSRIWSKLGITSSCLILKLRLSELGTEEAGSSLWATPTTMPGNLREQVKPEMVRAYQEASAEANGRMLTTIPQLYPTPTARDSKGANSLEHLMQPKTQGNNHHVRQLANAVKLLTTPCAADAQGSHGGKNHRSLRTDVAGQLNPTWVEWLMGFPIGWTDLNASETP